MLKIDDNLLQTIGLGGLPTEDKRGLLTHIYETLEMRVGMRLADQMTNEQLDEFETYFEAKDDAGAFKWLETNFPNYKDIVNEEFEKLKNEVQTAAPQILAAAQQNPATPQAAPAPDQQVQIGTPPSAPQQFQQPQPQQPQPWPPQPAAAVADPYAQPQQPVAPQPQAQPQQPWTPEPAAATPTPQQPEQPWQPQPAAPVQQPAPQQPWTPEPSAAPQPPLTPTEQPPTPSQPTQQPQTYQPMPPAWTPDQNQQNQ